MPHSLPFETHRQSHALVFTQIVNYYEGPTRQLQMVDAKLIVAIREGLNPVVSEPILSSGDQGRKSGFATLQEWPATG